MADSFILAKFVEMALKRAEIGFEILAQKFAQVAVAVLHVRDKFDAVAGRNNHALGHGRMLGKPLAGLRQTRFRNGQALAHLDRRGVVIDADELKFHDATNLCIPLK